MRICLINLDRSRDRLREFGSINSHLSAVSRFSAHDGRSFDLPELIRHGLIKEGLIHKDYYSLGALGCALSHIALWEHAIEHNETLTIAEDDAIFHPSFETQAPEIMERLPKDWDFILWGWNFDLFMCFEVLPGATLSISQFEQDRLRANIDKFKKQPITGHPFRLRWAFGTPCYSVTSKGAAALKSACVPLSPTITEFPLGRQAPPFSAHFRNVGTDTALNNAYAKINAFVCFPPLVVTKNERGKSTI